MAGFAVTPPTAVFCRRDLNQPSGSAYSSLLMLKLNMTGNMVGLSVQSSIYGTNVQFPVLSLDPWSIYGVNIVVNFSGYSLSSTGDEANLSESD